ncbi:hypothetical protein ACFFMN_34155 [Planobispora siamensis]|uniref:Uncharacterized protein n=1 Tax=Planobispora siamensis TaxID=936338 RepID=A0A8J3SFE8_9ACTN|nr:hypothetical protein [Planobispora siamensis]GIH91902.1 hypothetical protein Psi01_25320 [Planobispora siamensis]
MTDGDLSALARDYPGWTFWRSRSAEGRLGDYYATRGGFTPEPRTLAAGSVTELTALLQQAEVEPVSPS